MPVYLCKTSLSGMLRDPQLLMLWLRLGDESVNASIDGAAFRVGAGVQADITKTWEHMQALTTPKVTTLRIRYRV